MPQELHVLRCYRCQTFQVHIVKKSKKWDCKMCGEKQSLKKVYAKGSGRDCRLHVQRLNEMCMKKAEQQLLTLNENNEMQHEDVPSAFRYSGKNQICTNDPPPPPAKKSKWNEFLTEPEEDQDVAELSSVNSSSLRISHFTSGSVAKNGTHNSLFTCNDKTQISSGLSKGSYYCPEKNAYKFSDSDMRSNDVNMFTPLSKISGRNVFVDPHESLNSFPDSHNLEFDQKSFKRTHNRAYIPRFKNTGSTEHSSATFDEGISEKSSSDLNCPQSEINSEFYPGNYFGHTKYEEPIKKMNKIFNSQQDSKQASTSESNDKMKSECSNYGLNHFENSESDVRNNFMQDVLQVISATAKDSGELAAIDSGFSKLDYVPKHVSTGKRKIEGVSQIESDYSKNPTGGGKSNLQKNSFIINLANRDYREEELDDILNF